MEDILNKLLSKELLNEETQAELKEEVAKMLAEAREQVELQVRSELAEQWALERDKIIDSIDATVTDLLESELKEMRDDIASFRDLEAEFAQRLVEERKKLAAHVNSELDGLSEKLDLFLEQQLATELEALKEDIKKAQEFEFGRKIFEAFRTEFSSNFNDEDTLMKQLAVVEDQLRAANSRLMEVEKERSAERREKTMEKVLSTLQGTKREQMSIILQNVDTDRLQECYNLFIGRVLKEDVAPKQEVVVESVVVEAQKAKTEVVTGNEEIESESTQVVTESAVNERLLRLAGIR